MSFRAAQQQIVVISVVDIYLSYKPTCSGDYKGNNATPTLNGA